MRKLTGAEIRQVWIKFFESKGHVYIPGVSLVPEGDKSLLWVNAGVTGLKKYFDGSLIPPSRRIVNVQKCIRTNDIDNVGHTARHHTFFEMLGNFSIGDYFRPEVIPWAYEILTSEEVGFGIPVEKLYFTYQPDDKATFEAWRKAGVPEDHLIPNPDNFWEIGEGPCGPDTEMFFDRGEEYDPEHLGIKLLKDDIENDRYIEIWNIVFSQYNSQAGLKRSEYKELPSKNIDTGSGLERIACVLQGTETNFETDLFFPIIEEAKKIAKKPYEGNNLMAYRVIADHARSLTFALSDGAYFGNEGRGYVLRRLIRRAMRYGMKLGIDKPFMHQMVPVVVNLYKEFYDNLEKMEDFVVKMILAEEEKFLKTLSTGEALLSKMIEGKDSLPAEDAFRLYDTYGFPFELTKEICEEKGVKFNQSGFDALMKEQKERARQAREEVQSFHKQSKDLMAFDKKSEFSYEKTVTQSTVIGLFKDGVAVDEIDESGEVILDLTPFYAESGGQVSDIGKLHSETFDAQVVAMGKAPRGAHLHSIEVAYGSLHIGDKVEAVIDERARKLTARNHSATHLLHAALTSVLGSHADQKGSYVDKDILRFDYSCLSRPSDAELKEVERIVNEKILEGLEEKTLILPIEEAKRLGAEMAFEEKYGDFVRVVTFSDFSKEFCGGTHVRNSSEIGLFVIESDSSVSSGVRRIVGRTSFGAYSLLQQKAACLTSASSVLGGAMDSEIPLRIEGLQKDIQEKNREIKSLSDKISGFAANSTSSEIEKVGGVEFLVKVLEGGREDLLRLGDNLKSNRDNYFFLLLGKGGEKGSLVCFAKGDGATRLGAGNALKLVLPMLKGSGGGKSEMAQGSFTDLSAVDEVRKLLKSKLAA